MFKILLQLVMSKIRLVNFIFERSDIVLVQSAYVISVKWEKIYPKSGLEVRYELYRGII